MCDQSCRIKGIDFSGKEENFAYFYEQSEPKCLTRNFGEF